MYTVHVKRSVEHNENGDWRWSEPSGEDCAPCIQLVLSCRLSCTMYPHLSYSVYAYPTYVCSATAIHISRSCISYTAYVWWRIRAMMPLFGAHKTRSSSTTGTGWLYDFWRSDCCHSMNGFIRSNNVSPAASSTLKSRIRFSWILCECVRASMCVCVSYGIERMPNAYTQFSDIWRRMPCIFNVLSIAGPWIFPLKSVAVSYHLSGVIHHPIPLGASLLLHTNYPGSMGSHIVRLSVGRQYSMHWNWVYTTHKTMVRCYHLLMHIFHSIHFFRVCFTCFTLKCNGNSLFSTAFLGCMTVCCNNVCRMCIYCIHMQSNNGPLTLHTSLLSHLHMHMHMYNGFIHCSMCPIKRKTAYINIWYIYYRWILLNTNKIHAVLLFWFCPSTEWQFRFGWRCSIANPLKATALNHFIILILI